LIYSVIVQSATKMSAWSRLLNTGSFSSFLLTTSGRLWKCQKFSFNLAKLLFFESVRSFSDAGMYFTEFETENSKYTSDLVNLYVNSIGPLMVEVVFFVAVVFSFLTMFCVVHNIRLWRMYGGFCRQSYPKSSKASEISFMRKSYDNVILCSIYKRTVFQFSHFWWKIYLHSKSTQSPYMPAANLPFKNDVLEI